MTGLIVCRCEPGADPASLGEYEELRAAFAPRAKAP